MTTRRAFLSRLLAIAGLGVVVTRAAKVARCPPGIVTKDDMDIPSYIWLVETQHHRYAGRAQWRQSDGRFVADWDCGHLWDGRDTTTIWVDGVRCQGGLLVPPPRS